MAPDAAVAASSRWVDEDGVRQPAGDVHAWTRGTNQTLCGLALSRSELARFPHVPWADAVWLAQTGERSLWLCPRCSAALTPRKERGRSWTRVRPRP
ncbi:hypothetical protein [Saccharothrix coeruleofusca]|uniref:Uncharacterized protein n=1 Tax=Saccharothrix coeruleofusca TaxID=33919 RepID=A0A918AWV9_9PSEU|nr:hypothetical protein [Saccharothrix coeruleofusca]MBP2336902.1 hypothetical protein [Saccharothrix coeruleofusca]GGP82002.1 hypothetical protein GCM10010185_65070 [Saccharothrix coeruleofusca]